MQDENSIQDKIVMVMGGTGSFRRTMVKHLLHKGCREIRILSREEWRQEEMRIQLADPRLRFHIGNVRCRDSVDNAMRGVNLVFHAAALKQVQSCEFFSLQAVRTNILGSYSSNTTDLFNRGRDGRPVSLAPRNQAGSRANFI